MHCKSSFFLWVERGNHTLLYFRPDLYTNFHFPNSAFHSLSFFAPLSKVLSSYNWKQNWFIITASKMPDSEFNYFKSVVVSKMQAWEVSIIEFDHRLILGVWGVVYLHPIFHHIRSNIRSECLHHILSL